jgi:hypothetical protein
MLQMRALNNSGSVKLLALGVAAVLAFIGFEMYRRSTLAEERREHARLRADTDLAMQAIRARLQNPETCFQVLEGSFVAPGERSPVELRYRYEPLLADRASAVGSGFDSGPGNTIRAGSEVMKGISVAMIGLESDPQPDMATRLEIDGRLKNFFRFRARLQAIFEARPLDALGEVKRGKPVQINRTGVYHPITGSLITNLGIPLYVWVDGDANVTSCFGMESAGSVCNDLGGYFFPEPPDGDYTRSCRFSMHSARLDSSGTLTPIGSCRLSHTSPDKKGCRKKGDFKAVLYSQAHKSLLPALKSDRYMCLQCE